MNTVTIYGVSDDLIEVDGKAAGCDEYSSEDSRFVLMGQLEDGRSATVRIRCKFGAVWAITVAPVEEDAVTLPVKIGAQGDSAVAVIENVALVIREMDGDES